MTPAERGDAWSRTIVGWHVALYAMVGLVIVATLLRTGITDRERLALLGLAVLVAAAYATLGAPAARRRDLRRAVAYLAILITCTATIVAIEPGLYFLLLIAYPQAWFLLDDVRHGVVATVLLTLALGAGFVVGLGASQDTLREVGVQMVVSMLFSLLLGLWISRIIDQSQRRRELIAELEATRAELAETERQRGVLAERQRLAHEIHDTLAQGFTSILTLTQAIEAALDRDPAAIRERLALVEATARDNLAEARALVAALAPADLQGGTLVEAVERLVERFRAETGLVTSLTVSGEPRPLPINTEIVLLRVAQEALANVRKHAAAHRVDVVLSYDDGGPRLEIRDDGRGFDPLDVAGFGMHGMRARAHQHGGEVRVDTAFGDGTRVVVTVP